MSNRKIKCPRTKEELVNRILSYDFDGDLRHLGNGVKIERASPQSINLFFPEDNRVYELTVKIPRTAQPD